MAIAVASSSKSNIVYNNPVAATIDLPKPTDTAVGDFLIALTFGAGSDEVITPPAGWTSIVNVPPSVGSPQLSSFYKVATSTETAASQFQFSTNNTGAGNVGGACLRLTGSANLIADSDWGRISNSTAPSSTLQSGTGLQQVYAEAMIIQWWGVNPDGTVGPLFSTYAIATSDPTWTEQQESTTGVAAGFAVATATRTAITNTGALSSALAGAGANPESTIIGIAITPIQDATPTPAVVGVTINIQAPAISQDQTATPAVVGLTVNIQAPTIGTPPSWTNPSKSSPTWTSRDKSG